MSMIMENNSVKFLGVTYEDEIVALRDFLQLSSPSQVVFDFTECDDVHLAVLQLVLAYKKLYSAQYLFGADEKLYQKVCEGFETTEAHCL